MAYPDHIISLATFVLPTFLQVMAAIAVLSAWRRMYKPQLLRGRSILIINLDHAIRDQHFGSKEQMEAVANKIAKPINDGSDRIIYLYSDLTGNLNVNESLARWQEQNAAYSGPPIVITPGHGQQWASQLEHIKWSLGIGESNQNADKGRQGADLFRKNRITALIFEFMLSFNYHPGDIWGGERVKKSAPMHIDEDIDGLEHIFNIVNQTCENDAQKTQVMQRILFGAIRVLDIYQLRSEYHESIRNLHVHIRSNNSGSINVVQEIANGQGFDIKHNTSTYSHLLLGELPPESSRFFIVETGGRKLPDNSISLEYDLLSKLGPESLKLYTLIAMNVAVYSFIAKTLLAG